jgi:hypothetical protein
MGNVTKSKEMGNFKLLVKKKNLRDIQIGRARRRWECDIEMKYEEMKCKVLCLGWLYMDQSMASGRIFWS